MEKQTSQTAATRNIFNCGLQTDELSVISFALLYDVIFIHQFLEFYVLKIMKNDHDGS